MSEEQINSKPIEMELVIPTKKRFFIVGLVLFLYLIFTIFWLSYFDHNLIIGLIIIFTSWYIIKHLFLEKIIGKIRVYNHKPYNDDTFTFILATDNSAEVPYLGIYTSEKILPQNSIYNYAKQSYFEFFRELSKNEFEYSFSPFISSFKLKNGQKSNIMMYLTPIPFSKVDEEYTEDELTGVITKFVQDYKFQLSIIPKINEKGN